MTSEDLQRIEDALGIRLPASYRSCVLAFPIPAAVGNADLAVWDDADRVIALNRDARRGLHRGMRPWPARYFAIGHAGDGNPFALDLEAGDSVWFVFHYDLDDRETHQQSPSFAAWAGPYFASVREDMTGDLVDPDGSPDQRRRVEATNARSSAVGCAVALGVAILLAWLVRSCWR